MRALKRELIIAVIVLLLTVGVVFPAAFIVGSKTLGPYGTDGTMGDYVGSLFSALGDGNRGIWFFLLSPLLAISVVRLGWLGYRRL